MTGEITYSLCGCVFSENSEYRGASPRNLSGIVDNTGTGPDLSLKRHGKGLFTIIGVVQNKDSVDKSLSAKNGQTFAASSDCCLKSFFLSQDDLPIQ
jgi:transcription initiation factor TFIIIB Brf1 subunit/transcription initiation factor TFIIB